LLKLAASVQVYCLLHIIHSFLPLRDIIRALNSEDLPVVPSIDEHGQTRIMNNDGIPTIQRGLRFIDFGLSDEGIRRRLNEIMHIMEEAQSCGSSVVWC